VASLPLVPVAGLWTHLHYQLIRSALGIGVDQFAEVGPGLSFCLTDDHTELLVAI